MAEPVDDMCFADMAPHIAERAAAEQAEYAELGRRMDTLLDEIDALLHGVPRFSEKRNDPRKHDGTCHARHVDCLADALQKLIRE